MSSPFVTWPARLALIGAVGAVGTLGGCALPPVSPVVDTNFGDSVRRMVALQTANPDAGRRALVSGNFDAQSAVSAINKHRDTFKTPPPTFTIFGIGGSGGAQ